MKKILLLNNGYPSAKRPNYVAYIQSMKECLEEAGFHVDLLVMSSDFDSSAGKYFNFLKYYLRALVFHKYRVYDYIYINNFPYSFIPLIIHFRKMKRMVIHWHGDDIFPGSSFSKYLNKLSYRFIRPDTIHIAPSSYFALQTERRLSLPAGTVHVSPSGGVDIHAFKQTEEHQNPSILRLGFASGLIRSKGMELIILLLEKAHEIENLSKRKIEFHYIEYGAEKLKYTDLLSKHSFVRKHSPYPVNRMSEFYNQIDILLFPSIREAESLGLVAIEAMACNIPVIASDAFGFKETVIEGVSGERFKTNDIHSFYDALIRCIRKLNTYTSRNFIIHHYSRTITAERYKQILN